jgi:hypothetical protein
MKLTNLRDYVEKKKQWYLDTYGDLGWKWYDEGLVWAIQDYQSMVGDFAEDDIKFLDENGFIVEEFIEED